MPTYRETLDQMPSLGDMFSRMRARRQQNRNPGDVPQDASGGPVKVSVDGERPMMAQPVGSGAISGVSVGRPTGRHVTIDPMTVNVGGRQPGQIAQRRQQLMAQGLNHGQSMQQMAHEGVIDPRMAEMLTRAGGNGG